MHLFYNLFWIKITRNNVINDNADISDNEILIDGSGKTEIDVQSQIVLQTKNEIQDSFQNVIRSHSNKRIQLIKTETEKVVFSLNQKIYNLEKQQDEIESIHFPEAYKSDKDLEVLDEILKNNKIESKLSITKIAIEKIKSLWKNFDNEIDKQSTANLYHRREVEKAKQFKKFKHDIEQLQIAIDKQIAQNHFIAAKESIRSIEGLLSSIKNLSIRIQPGKGKENKRIVANLIAKTNDLKRKLTFKENEQEKKRQEEKFIKEQEEAQNRINKQVLSNLNEVDFYDDIENNKLLLKCRIKALYHMTEFSNLDNIFKYGLLSHTEAHNKGLVKIDISDNEVNRRRNSKETIFNRKIHDYVPMYFNPKNPMLYKRKNLQNDIVLLELDSRLIYQKNSLFTDGNAASEATKFFNNLKDLDTINFNFVLSNNFWQDYVDGKRKKMAEVLVFPLIDKKFIMKIHCCNINTVNKVREKANSFRFDISCSLTSNLYFQ